MEVFQVKVIILGAGRIGSAMASDLSVDSQLAVSVADIDETLLAHLKEKLSVETINSDLSKIDNVKKLVENYDIVVNAVPGFLGFQTFKAVIETGKHVVDIAFFSEDPFQLNDLAKKKNVVAIMDCGVAPGMSNMLVGYVDQTLDTTESVTIYVGGLPVVREWPFEYKAPFSPIDVIEEYTRPARLKENGEVITREALSEVELLNFQNIGTLEAFNTDGLRTLLETINAPNMKEKTLRYPGHVQKMEMLKHTGFFDQRTVDIKGNSIKPIDFTTKLLFPMWELKPGEEDLTLMQIIVEGKKNGKQLRYVYELFDRFDSETHTTSMARTTGYTATMAVRMIASGKYVKKGVSPPEFIGQNSECVDFILKGLKQRGVVYNENVMETD